LNNDITVHELVFDHMQSSIDGSKPPPTLWFNIPKDARQKMSTANIIRITCKKKELKRTDVSKRVQMRAGMKCKSYCTLTEVCGATASAAAR